MANTPGGERTPRLCIGVLARSVYPFHGHGGLERHVHDLVRHLVAREVRVVLVTPPDRRPARPPGEAERNAERLFEDPRCRRRTVPYLTFPLAGRRGTTVIDRSTAYPLFGYRAGRAMAGIVARGEVDVVYGLGASALGYARARRQGARAPFVFNPQGLEEFGATTRSLGRLKSAGYAPLRAAVRACARSADRVIATDSALEPVVRRHLHLDAERIRVVPNGIDIDACDTLTDDGSAVQLRSRHGIGDRERILLSVGRLEANKGFHVLARALAPLSAEDGWRWVLVGDGPYRPAIDRAIAASGIGPHVVFAGRVGEADLHAWYEAATLFVHPTLYEGSSLVTLEAMAHHLAVVATTAGGLPDKVRPGASGWLVEPGNEAALGRAVQEALACGDRLPVMGREGRRIAEDVFSWPRVVGAFLDVCAELLEKRAQD